MNDFYLKILEPLELIKEFKTDAEFTSWCETGTIEDLKCTLTTFEAYELYEHCKIIKDVIIEKYKR